MQPGFHGALGDAERLRDLAQRQSVNETQRERFPLAGRQQRKEPADVPVIPGRAGGNALGRDVIGNREPDGLALRRERRVFRNGVQQRRQPGGERYPQTGGREPAQQLHEGVLEHVQCGIDVGRDAQRHTQHVILVAQVQGFERHGRGACITLVAGAHQRFVTTEVSHKTIRCTNIMNKCIYEYTKMY